MKKVFAATLMTALVSTMAAEKSDEIKISPLGTVRAKITNDTEGTTTMGVTRAYIGGKATYGDAGEVKVVYDIAQTPFQEYDAKKDVSTPSTKYTPFLKNAYLKWKCMGYDKLHFTVGVQGTYGWINSYKNWGLNHLTNPVGVQKFGYVKNAIITTADMGFTASAKFGDVKVGAGVFDGNGYKAVGKDDMLTPKYGMSVEWTAGDLYVEEAAYVRQDVANSDADLEISNYLNAGFKGKAFRAGIESGFKMNNGFDKDAEKEIAVALFTVVPLAKKVDAFVRGDLGSSDHSEFRVFAGANLKPFKKAKITGAFTLNNVYDKTADKNENDYGVGLYAEAGF